MTVPSLPGLHKEIGSDGDIILIPSKNEVKNAVEGGIANAKKDIDGSSKENIIAKETRQKINESIASSVKPEAYDKTVVDPKSIESYHKDLAEYRIKEFSEQQQKIQDISAKQLKLRQRIIGIRDGNIPGTEEDIDRYTRQYDLLEEEKSRLEGQISDIRKQNTDMIVNGGIADAKIEFRSKSDKNATVVKNVLNEFINVQYHISLSMIPDYEVREIQEQLLTGSMSTSTVDQFRSEIQRTGAVTIASTGSILDDPDIHYYNIKSLELKNIMTPSSSNPMLSTLVTCKMRVSEPLGLKLHEDIRSIAESIGYKVINPGRIVYRIDVWFSGYNPDNGEWVSQIPLDLRSEQSPSVVTYFMSLAKMEAKVTAIGTDYELEFVHAGHFAYRPEVMTLDATSVFTKDANTFGAFLDALEVNLTTQKEARNGGVMRRTFKFYAPEVLRNATFYSEHFANEKSYINNDRTGNTIHVGKDIDLLTLLQSVLADLERVQKFFLADNNNEAFLVPRVHFTVRFNTKYGNKSENNLYNDYDDITYEYIIEPFITFKEGTVEPKNLDIYVDRENQLARIKEMLRYGMILRRYDYLYSGENTEVLDFNIDLKTFYYKALNGFRETAGTSGQNISESTTEQSINRNYNNVNTTVVLQNDSAVDDSALRRVFGNSLDKVQTNSSLELDRFHIHGGGFNDKYSIDETNTSTSSAQKSKQRYLQLFDEHMTDELLSLNDMTIRGDPIWLLSAYSSNGDGVADTVEVVGAPKVIRAQTGKVIFLNIQPPNQEDYMNPNRVYGSSYPQMIAGFYEVTDVTSKLEGGKFIQTLNGYKMNHLNYINYDVKIREPQGEVTLGMPQIVNPITGDAPIEYDNPGGSIGVP